MLSELEKEHNRLKNEIEKSIALIKSYENDIIENKNTIKIQNEMISLTEKEMFQIMEPSIEPLDNTIMDINRSNYGQIAALKNQMNPKEELKRVV